MTPLTSDLHWADSSRTMIGYTLCGLSVSRLNVQTTGFRVDVTCPICMIGMKSDPNEKPGLTPAEKGTLA